MCFKIKGLLKKFQAWNIIHINWAQNEEAHEAAQSMINEVFVIKDYMLLFHGRES